MSDTHDLGGAAANVEGLTTKTVALTSAATTFAKTMTQAFASSSAGGQKFDDVLKSLAGKMTSLASNPTTGVASGLQGIVSGLIGNVSNVKPFAAGGIRHLIAVEPDEIAAGDVLLFRWRDGCVAKHAAIASGAGTMIHAHDGAAVCEVTLAPWWQRRLGFVFRFPETSRGA
jgi:NlpC/P60 family putative phage cell wall peptidase